MTVEGLREQIQFLNDIIRALKEDLNLNPQMEEKVNVLITEWSDKVALEKSIESLKKEINDLTGLKRPG